MKTKHTPKPWVIGAHDDTEEIVIRGNEHGGHFIVCNLEVDDYWDEAPETIKANANLIAAAPELLEACQKAFNYVADDLYHYSDVGDDDAIKEVKEMYNRLSGVIDKAKGES